MMVWPAMISVPVRAGVGLASAVKVTVPVPLAALIAVMWIHGALLAAVHAQPCCVVTVTLKVPPVGYPAMVDPIDRPNVHAGIVLVVGSDVVAGVGAAGGVTLKVSGLAPPQVSIWSPGVQFNAAVVSGPE